MAKELIVKLTHKPITVLGKEVTEFKLREPEFGDILDCEVRNDHFALMASILVTNGDIPMSSVRKIHPKDLMAIGKVLEPFLGS